MKWFTLGLDLVLDLGLLVAAVLFILGLALAEVDAVPTFDCTLGLARAALALAMALGLFSALAVSSASRPIRLPLTYEGCSLTRGGM